MVVVAGLVAGVTSTAYAECEQISEDTVRCTVCGVEECCDTYFSHGPTGPTVSVCYPV
jgi:hypothetical protein